MLIKEMFWWQMVSLILNMCLANGLSSIQQYYIGSTVSRVLLQEVVKSPSGAIQQPQSNCWSDAAHAE